MDLLDAREVVFKRKAELEKELASGPTPYERRLIILNINACDQMLMYLHLLSIGKRVRFKVIDPMQIEKKLDLVAKA